MCIRDRLYIVGEFDDLEGNALCCEDVLGDRENLCVRCRRSSNRNFLTFQCCIVYACIIAISRVVYCADNRAVIFAGDEVCDLLAFECCNERFGLVSLLIAFLDSCLLYTSKQSLRI